MGLLDVLIDSFLDTMGSRSKELENCAIQVQKSKKITGEQRAKAREYEGKFKKLNGKIETTKEKRERKKMHK